MKKRLAYIPTLQEYAKKRKRLRDEIIEISACSECDYFRKDIGVCLWNDCIRDLSNLQTCPINNRDL